MTDYEIETITSHGRPALHIEIDGDEVSVKGFVVESHYYEEVGEQHNDTVQLLSDGIEHQLDLDENTLRFHFGFGRARIHFPEEFIDELEEKLDSHNVPN